jgi:cytochrome b561
MVQDKKTKMDLMFAHKSLGLLMGGAIAARVGLRLSSKVPVLPEGNALMHLAANASHVAMYAFMLIMPATGVVMGYYGGAVRVLPAPRRLLQHFPLSCMWLVPYVCGSYGDLDLFVDVSSSCGA